MDHRVGCGFTEWPTTQTNGQYQKLVHTYCSTLSYWLLKWDCAGGLAIGCPPLPTNRAVHAPDLEWDGLVDVGTDVASPGPNMGTAFFHPLESSPIVVMPLANPPGWYGGLPVHAYLAQADAKALPYRWLVPGLADQDGYDTAYSLNTRVLEAGVVDQVQPCGPP